MNTSTITPMTRDQLRELPEKHRKQSIGYFVNNISSSITQTATLGKTNYLVDIENSTRFGHYTLTIDDMMEGFRAKFPDCKIEYTERWEEVRANSAIKKKGILIDWSPDTEVVRRNSVTLKL